MLTGVTVSCFVSSYLIVLGLELSRYIFRAPLRMILLIIMMLLGLTTHLLYLVDLGMSEFHNMGTQFVMGSWYDWSLLAAWILAFIYFIMLISRPDASFGSFLLPMVMALVAMAMFARNLPPFSRDATVSFWRLMHAGSLLISTVLVTLGFVVGMMFLIHANRLKQKRLRTARSFKLPSLEYLQSLNRICLYISTAFVAIGVAAGFIMNINKTGKVSWAESGIWLSMLLLAWLLATSGMAIWYRSAARGKQVAYLTLASFGFLVLVLSATLLSQHGEGSKPNAPPSAIRWRSESPLFGMATSPAIEEIAV